MKRKACSERGAERGVAMRRRGGSKGVESRLRGAMRLVALAALFSVALGARCQRTDRVEIIDSGPVGELGRDIDRLIEQMRQTLNWSEKAVQTLGMLPPEVSTAGPDMSLLRFVFEQCFTDEVVIVDESALPVSGRSVTAQPGAEPTPLRDRRLVGRMEPCLPARLRALEAHADVLGDPVRSFVVARMLLVDGIRATLKDVLPAVAERAVLQANAGRADLEDLIASADESYIQSKSMRLSPGSRLQIEESLLQFFEVADEVEAALDEMDALIVALRDRRRRLIADAARNIALLGLPE